MTNLDPQERRREVLLEALRRYSRLTLQSAWEHVGLYAAGDARLIKDDLNALCAQNQARKHGGSWRARTDRERQAARLWADYWEAR